MHEDRGVEMVTAGRPPGLEQSVNAFNLLRDFSEGAIVVDAQTRITWIDERYPTAVRS